MKVIVELNALQENKYNKDLLAQIAQETIETSKITNCEKKKITLSVALVDNDEMRRVNKELRGQDNVTNVLSVGEYSDEKNIAEESQDEIFLGEVILCYNYIEESARKNGDDVNKEFFTIYAHGVLHLLGFVHGKEMFHLQDNIGEKFVV
jgi:probable rRNA maturation factor